MMRVIPYHKTRPAVPSMPKVLQSLAGLSGWWSSKLVWPMGSYAGVANGHSYLCGQWSSKLVWPEGIRSGVANGRPLHTSSLGHGCRGALEDTRRTWATRGHYFHMRTLISRDPHLSRTF